MPQSLLQLTTQLAEQYLEGVNNRFVGPLPAQADLIKSIGADLPAKGESPEHIIKHLARAADPGIVANAGPRYFGFVIGATLPAARAADWLVSTWDQCAGFVSLSPAAAAIEQIVQPWTLDLLDLPRDCTVGYVTGCQQANSMSLAAARQAVLKRVGWNVAERGLIGAPRIRLITTAETHGTINRAFAMLGLGADTAIRIPCDVQGRMIASALEEELNRSDAPTIVCAQAGNVDTGSFDPFEPIVKACRAHNNCWLHVDGAFGLWARACPEKAHLAKGVEGADSWATDAHKWLNTPYDCGIVIVRDLPSLLVATSYKGEYLVKSETDLDPSCVTPESSRRARAIPLYAAFKELGRDGVADLVSRTCALARRAADRLQQGGANILNDVVLNQVLIHFDPPAGTTESDHINAIVRSVQEEGTCWLGATTWQNRRAMRLSVSAWPTTEHDIDISVDSILRCAQADH